MGVTSILNGINQLATEGCHSATFCFLGYPILIRLVICALDRHKRESHILSKDTTNQRIPEQLTWAVEVSHAYQYGTLHILRYNPHNCDYVPICSLDCTPKQAMFLKYQNGPGGGMQL